jgi:hypothetical protein
MFPSIYKVANYVVNHRVLAPRSFTMIKCDQLCMAIYSMIYYVVSYEYFSNLCGVRLKTWVIEKKICAVTIFCAFPTYKYSRRPEVSGI